MQCLQKLHDPYPQKINWIQNLTSIIDEFGRFFQETQCRVRAGSNPWQKTTEVQVVPRQDLCNTSAKVQCWQAEPKHSEDKEDATAGPELLRRAVCQERYYEAQFAHKNNYREGNMWRILETELAALEIVGRERKVGAPRSTLGAAQRGLRRRDKSGKSFHPAHAVEVTKNQSARLTACFPA